MKMRIGRIALAGVTAASLLLGCHAGTPSAPDGTEIVVSCEFLSQDVPTGDFEALIKAVVIDQDSDVPQVGVGVYFRVTDGPGQMVDEGPIRTDNAGRAQAVLIGHGATSANSVTVEVSSGPVSSNITLDVSGCFSPPSSPPHLVFTLTPNPARANQAVTVDLSDSTDSDCPGGEPDSWRIDWGDGDTTNGQFSDNDHPTHTYASADIPSSNSIDIDIEIEDCQGNTDTDTATLNFTP